MILDYDLCIIGGGINGAGIARDAAGRGLKVLLVEKGDLACATSSASTKLVHGGLRYLEHYNFKLVRESLREREVLLSIAPQLVWPTTFVLPHDKRQRPRWMIRSGLFLYDNLAKRKRLEKSQAIDLKTHAFGKPLRSEFTRAFSYSDCRTDDSRLVVLNVMDAANNGAQILPRTECLKIEPHGRHWRLSLKDAQGMESGVTAGAVVNATGPWVRDLAEKSAMDTPDVPRLRLVKGSHIIVPRAFEGTQAYILQQMDKRIVFAIPYEDDYTLIGTTDVPFEGDPKTVAISDDEIEYLLAAYNGFAKNPVSRKDILWTYSGVRSLFDDGKENASSVTRDFYLHAHKDTKAPLISVFGGKLTTYRVLAEKTVNMLMQEMGRKEPAWTAHAPLPGGDMPHADFELFQRKKITQYAGFPEKLIRRYARQYGTRMDHFLEGARKPEDLGRSFGDDIYEAEIFYLVQHEWARTMEDIMWRRTKLGLRASDQTVKNIEDMLPAFLEKILP